MSLHEATRTREGADLSGMVLAVSSGTEENH